MTTIEIKEMTKKEQDALWLNDRPDFKMIDENTGMIGNCAIIEFNERDPQVFDDEKERAAEICERYTNIEIMQALVLMIHRGESELYKLPKYIAEFSRMGEYDRPIDFYPFIKNEDEMRQYLYDEWINDEGENTMQAVNEYIESFGDECEYTPIGALIWNY